MCPPSRRGEQTAITTRIDWRGGNRHHVDALAGVPFKFVRFHGQGQARVLACWVFADPWETACIWPSGEPWHRTPRSRKQLVPRVLHLLLVLRRRLRSAPRSAQRVLGFVPAKWVAPRHE